MIGPFEAINTFQESLAKEFDRVLGQIWLEAKDNCLCEKWML
jgi:hypothetical protein